jgi:Sec-independent protein secretion pathway component TatC
VPLGLLYELAVFAVSLIEKRRNAAKAKADAAEAAEEAAEAAKEQTKLPTNPV